MIYQCDHCGEPLPAGMRVCPACGEEFEGAVPADAEVPRPGFTAVPQHLAGSGLAGTADAEAAAQPPAMKWLDPPAPRGAPAAPGAWGRALLILAVVAVLALAVHFVR